MNSNRFDIIVPIPFIAACLMLFSVFFSIPVHAQGAFSKNRISIAIDARTSLKDVLQLIEIQGKAHFIYDESALKGYDIERFIAKNETVDQVLSRILVSTPFALKRVTESGNILIVRRSAHPDRTIHGKVVDARTREALPGVTLRIKGSGAGTVSDANGNFVLQVANPEQAVLVITYIGYVNQQIKIGNQSTFNVFLNSSSTTIGEVTVQARRRLNTETTLLNERKTNAVVSDGISAQQMTKTASITTTQALQRVSGVTVTDDKYVAIRGLGDRSVIAELNGARLSSADPDRSSVPLDLVPAALLDNVTVYKTETPDKPADASAGIIELKTKSVPDSLTVEFTAQTGSNTTIGLGGKFNSWQDANPGFFGQNVNKNNLTPEFLNLSNQYLGGVTQIKQLISNARNTPALTQEAFRIDRIMHEFSPVIVTKYQKVTPNQIYAVNFGNTFKIFGGHQFGVVLGLSYYNRTEDQSNSQLNQYSIYSGYVTGSPLIFGGLRVPYYTTPDLRYFGKYLGYTENLGKQTLNYGGLAGLTYKFNRLNEISFQYLGSWGAEIEARSLNGAYQNTGINLPFHLYNQVYGLRQSYRTFRNLNLQGEHKLWNNPFSPRISWNAATSKSTQNEPDFRFVDIANLDSMRNAGPLAAPVGSSTFVEVAGVAHVNGPHQTPFLADPNGRRFRKLSENNDNYKVDIIFPTVINQQKVDFKIGGNYLKRDRKFTENVLGLPGSTYDDPQNVNVINQLKGDLNKLVGFDQVGILNPLGNRSEGSPYQPGFIYQIKKSPNNYTGFYRTEAFYAMMDAHLTKQLRLVGGVRFETTDIRANVDTTNVYQNPGALVSPTTNGNGTVTTNIVSVPNTGFKTDLKPYYSGNLIYTFRQNMNFRVAYSTTLARPELREITNVFEFDPFQFAIIGGNPNLRNQLTRSLDFRWEWFTHPGEVFSASVFGKQIERQLTRTFKLNSLGTLTTVPEYPVLSYQNDPNTGRVYGIELEARKDLGKLNSALRHFFFGTNVLLAQSVITKNPERLAASRIINRYASDNSPLFEQAPYSVNAYLDYDNPKAKTNVTASFNIVGERLVQVQLDGSPDIYSRPVPLLDFVFSQRLGRRFLVKGFAKNIFNAVYEQVYTVPGNNGNFNGRRYINQRYFRGTELELGLTFDLF